MSPDNPPLLVHALIVDDSGEFRKTLRKFLKPISWIAVADEVASGEDAVKRVRRERFDLVLMDIALPGMSGLAATRVIKATDLAPPVIVLTQHGDRAYREGALEAGADGFVVKSDLFSTLVPAIREAQARRGIAAES